MGWQFGIGKKCLYIWRFVVVPHVVRAGEAESEGFETETVRRFLVKWSLKFDVFPLYFNTIWQCRHAIFVFDTSSLILRKPKCCQIGNLAFLLAAISNSPLLLAMLFIVTRHKVTHHKSADSVPTSNLLSPEVCRMGTRY